MKVDCHIHTLKCGHADGTAEEYIRSAMRKGIELITFTDHAPLWYMPPDYGHQDLKRPIGHLGEYLDHVRMAQWWYDPFPVAVGLEIDYIPGQERDMQRTIDGAELDYVLGSVHFVDGALLYYPEVSVGRSGEDVWERYLDLSAACAETGLVDAIAHIDVLKGYVAPPPSVGEMFRTTARRIARAGVCIELNTSGLRDGMGLSPTSEFLAICHEEGVEMTFGSDAHSPEDVGSGMEAAEKALLAAGYDQVALFLGRKKRLVSTKWSV